MRTVKEPDVRRQEILEGAIRVFAREGYDGATIASIARELKISQGLCYRYFPSKEDIYRAAIDRYADVILAEYLQTHQEDTTLAHRIEDIGASIARLTAAEGTDPDLYALFHRPSSAPLHNELLLRVAARLLPHIQAMLRHAKAQGEIHIDDPDGTAIIGLYGELGLFFTPGVTEEYRAGTIRSGWQRLLGLT